MNLEYLKVHLILVLLLEKKNIYICTYNNMFYFIIDFKPICKKVLKYAKKKIIYAYLQKKKNNQK